MSDLQPPQRPDWPEGAVFTVGHSTLPIERFIAVLRAYGIELVVDVRTVPRSRRNPQFNGDALAESLATVRVDYVQMRELGGLRRARADSPNTGWRNASFRGYADHMQTEAFAAALDRLVDMSREKRLAMMCAEAVPWRCHRSLIADALVVRGIEVDEIVSAARLERHALTPFARVEGTVVTYPAAATRGERS